VVGAGQFVYTYNGVTRTLAATSTTTLQNLVDLINKDSGNPGVTASILDYDVSGDPDKRFHLVLSGGDSGQDYGITIGAGTTVAGFAPGANWTQTQAAVNAQIRVDGYPAGNWIERSSNTISDVIPGVTINLVSPGTASVTLTRSTSQLNEEMTNLVNIYNGIATQVKKYTGYNTDTKTGGVLEGDSLDELRASIAWAEKAQIKKAAKLINEARQPVIIAGGSAGDFLGEYMAGGMLIVLGLVGMRAGQPSVGRWCGTGMHGGAIYLRGEVDPASVASQFATAAPVSASDCDRVRPYVEEFCRLFEIDRAAAFEPGFTKIAPVSHRPFGAKYAA
jgi:hypothetical protein